MYTLESNGWAANCNSDLSGNVIFFAPDGARHEIPGDMLMDLVAEVVRRERIDRLEQAAPAELLGVVE